MLLTRASEYALLTLDYLRRHTKPIGAEQLAMDLNIPKSFLAKILQNLAKQGILDPIKVHTVDLPSLELPIKYF